MILMAVPTTRLRIITIDRTNVETSGFFCHMSRRQSDGFRDKLAWIKERFDEGLRLKMLELPERGFIEYISGERAWRAVNAPGHMVVHCLWVVGKSKGKGLGGALLDECVKDARKAGMAGIAVVTGAGNWLAGKKLFESRGFRAVDMAPPSFTLMAKRLRPGPDPAFPRDWSARAKRFGSGLTVITTGQCPYLPDAARILLEAAAKKRIEARTVRLRTAREVQTLSPSPYGTFAIVLDGKLLGHHYLTARAALEALSRKP